MESVSDLAVARGIKEQLQASGRPRTWRRMTTILSAYGVYRLTDSVRHRIEAAFTAAGLSTEPSLLTVERSGSVRLWVTGSGNTTGKEAPSKTGLPNGVTVWHRTGGQWTTLIAHQPGTLFFVDVDFSAMGDPEDVSSTLTHMLPGLEADTLADLLDQDKQASFSQHRNASAARRASLFLATPDEGPLESPQDAVLISMELVEFAVGEDWLLIVRHPPVMYVGGSPLGNDPSTPTGEVYLDSLLDHGLSEAASPEALALVVINQAIYSLSRAKTELDTSLELWRTASRRHAPEKPALVPDKTVLVDVQATLPILLHALEPLQHPTVKVFMGPEGHSQAREVRDQVDRDIDALRTLQATTAAALAQADQAQNEADQARNERHQASLATLAGVLLAPALIASIFGANPALSSSPLDLVWLFLAMIAAGVITWLAIKIKFNRDRQPPIRPRSPDENRVGIT